MGLIVMRTSTGAVLFVCLSLSLGCGEPDSPICDAAELETALAAAGPGDVVRLGSCDIPGTFTVGPGVTLVGAAPPDEAPGPVGPTRTFVGPAPEGQPTLTLVPGPEPTAVRHVVVGGTTVIRIAGPGRAHLDGVEVLVAGEGGIGVEVADGTDVTMVDVRVSGATENVTGRDPVPVRDTVGIQVTCASRVALTDVVVSGCTTGAGFEGGEVSWSGGGAMQNVTGALFDGVVATLEGLDLSENLRGSGFPPGQAGAFVMGAPSLPAT